MAGLSPKLPITRNDSDGFTLNKTFKEMIQQNLKLLLLTSPGERIMDTFFGVGLRHFFFEQITPTLPQKIEARIRQQVERYMPFVQINNVDFGDIETNMNTNMLFCRVEYEILPLDEEAVLEIAEKIN